MKALNFYVKTMVATYCNVQCIRHCTIKLAQAEGIQILTE